MDRDAIRATLTPIEVGKSYPFFSTLQGIDGNGFYPCLYTGRTCTVVRQVPDADYDREDIGEVMYDVRFEDGAILGVFSGEIDGWFQRTGQFHGPFAVEQRAGDKPADFEINNNRPARED